MSLVDAALSEAPVPLSSELARWQAEGRLDAATASGIRADYIASRRFSLSRLLLGLGGAFVGVGLLWLVAANIDELSPLSRFVAVVLLWLGAVAAGEMLADGVPGHEIPDRIGQAVESFETVPLLARALEDAGVEAPVLSGLARLIGGDLPLDDWVALVRTTVPPPARGCGGGSPAMRAPTGRPRTGSALPEWPRPPPNRPSPPASWIATGSSS